MKYETILKDLNKINLNICNLDFINNVFIYGSVSKLIVHEFSDIDILLIGNVDKNITTLSAISKFFEDLNLINEIDFKYYNVNKFREIYKNNRFLQIIQKDCTTIDSLIVTINDLVERRCIL